MNTYSQNLDEALAFAIGVADDAGSIMRDYFYRVDQGQERKDDDTIVTQADKLVNQLLIERVNADRPEEGVLGEEASVRTGAEVLWVCDPIDGTNGFATGLPTAVFSLAYVVDGEPFVAVILNPFTRELFTAIKGGGARCNADPISVSGRGLSEAVIAGPGGLNELRRHLPLYDSLCKTGATVRPFGGMVYQCCLVARGKLDARLFPGYGAHDMAAAQLLVEEAGGTVTDVLGNRQRYDGPIKGAIISNSVIHDDLKAALKDFGPEDFLGF